MPRTIVASNFLSTKEVTKEEYARQWEQHAQSLVQLSSDADWLDKVKEIMEATKLEAEDEFERVYKFQNPDGE